MFIDARAVERGQTLKTSICVIGGGIAGISVAQELAGTNHPVILIESGGLEFDPATHELTRDRMDGTILDSGAWGQVCPAPPTEFYLRAARRRFLGGTSNAWSGWCLPCDDQEFARRDWVPHSGWPIARGEVEPFHERAAELCQVQPFPSARAARSGTRPPWLPDACRNLTAPLVHVGPPSRFGEAYREALGQSANVQVVTHGNVVRLETDAQGRHVLGAQVRTLQGHDFAVAARVFVLAAGAVENARLLLLSNQARPQGLGNGSGQVGRYYMDHARQACRLLVLNPPGQNSDYYTGADAARGTTRALLSLTDAAQRQHRLPGLVCSFEDKLTDQRLGQGDRCLAAALRACGSLATPTPEWHSLFVYPEPIPNSDSRVFLDDRVDPLGCRRARVDWQLHEADSPCTRRGLELIGAELARASLGRLRLLITDDQPFPEGKAGHHHAGTTRMSRDPSDGVVNPQCRLHEVDNLYVAGCSVFPTLRCPYPTLTMVALALRLARHLQEIVRS